jgi:chemotaxis-related protein WspB
VVPVIDMCRLLANRAAKSVMSTRVVVVEFPCADGKIRGLGLVAESILEIRSVESASFEEPVIRIEGAPYLGPILKDGSKLIQVIELPRLLPESLQETLFSAGGTAA